MGRGTRARCSAARPEDREAREFPDFAGFLFGDVEVDSKLVDGSEPVLAAAEDELENLEPYTAETIETGLRGLAERLELKPRAAFEPIRIAVTGSKVSPGLFESLELLGREKSVERIKNARAAAARARERIERALKLPPGARRMSGVGPRRSMISRRAIARDPCSSSFLISKR